VGVLLQFALSVLCALIAGAGGLAVGAHVGTPPPPPDDTQVMVCVGGVPEIVKLVQLGLVYVNVAAGTLGEKTKIAAAAAKPQSARIGRTKA
jgi:hypothetical protein